MHVLTYMNQKGGVGKSSTCLHTAGVLAQRGRVLLVDNDPQASLTQGLWGPNETAKLDPAMTLAAVYTGEAFPEQVIHATGIPNLDLVPGSRVVNDWNLPRPHETPIEAQFCLREFLEPLRDQYQFCLIDGPPNLCLCSWAALVASDRLIVPLQAEDFGSQGLGPVQELVAMVTSSLNPDLKLLGYLIQMFSSRKSIHALYASRLRDLYGSDVFTTVIPYAVDFPEAIAHRKPVSLYRPRGAAAKAISALVDEMIERLVPREAEAGTEAA